MATEEPPPDRRRGILFLLLAVVLALVISVFGSYLVVVSQNPSKNVTGPAFVYGSPSPGVP
jgi:hypothetical protein